MSGRHTTKGYVYGMVGCLLLMAFGIFSVFFKTITPERFTNVSRMIPWGLTTAVLTVFLSLAIGCCLVGAMGRVYGLKGLRPLTRRAVYIAMIAMVSAFLLLMVTVENPWRLLIYNAIFPNLRSNIWWLVTLSGITAGCVFLEFAAMLNGGGDSKFIFGFMGAVTGVGASNNLAALITGTMDPPLWFGPQLLVLYLLSAVLVGMATVLGATLLLALLNGRELGKAEKSAVETAVVVMQYLCVILLGLYGVRLGTVFYHGTDPGYPTAQLLFSGPYLLLFFLLGLGGGLVVPLLFFLLGKWRNLRMTVCICLLVIVGLFFQRASMLVAGQSVPKLGVWLLPGQPQGYFPSFWEFGVAGGAVGLLGVALLVGERVFGKFFRTSSQPARKPF